MKPAVAEWEDAMEVLWKQVIKVRDHYDWNPGAI